MSLTLQELLDWVPEIGGLAKAAHDVSSNHANSAEFLRGVVKASTWVGEAGDTARMSMLATIVQHDDHAERIGQGAADLDKAHQDAEMLANKVKDVLNFAAAQPAVNVDTGTNAVTPPPSYDYLDEEAKTEVAEKVADVEARIADVLDEGERVDDELARAIAKASGLPGPVHTATSLGDLLGVPTDGPLAPGEVRNNGPVAGTDGKPGVPGIGAADLGEVVTLPNGRKVMILGDSYGKAQVGPPGDPTNQHYPSAAVPVTFDAKGRPHFGPPLSGPDGKNVLFPLPQAAKDAGANNALPAGSVTIGKDTYMMVVGTNTNEGLNPRGGSWLVKVSNDPAAGWRPVEGSYRPWSPNADPGPNHLTVGTRTDSPPTQISGYQGSDGKVYIAADAFDRSQGVTMYRVDPDHITDRGAWQPYNGNNTWGAAGQTATTTITPSNQNWGELSFREVDGKPVLSGTNFNSDVQNGLPTVEVHVGDNPTQVLNSDTSTKTVVMSDDLNSPNFVPAPYGGYILPGSTLDNLGIFGSQWYQPQGGPVHYDVQDIQVNVEPGRR